MSGINIFFLNALATPVLVTYCGTPNNNVATKICGATNVVNPYESTTLLFDTTATVVNQVVVSLYNYSSGGLIADESSGNNDIGNYNAMFASFLNGTNTRLMWSSSSAFSNHLNYENIMVINLYYDNTQSFAYLQPPNQVYSGGIYPTSGEGSSLVDYQKIEFAEPFLFSSTCASPGIQCIGNNLLNMAFCQETNSNDCVSGIYWMYSCSAYSNGDKECQNGTASFEVYYGSVDTGVRATTVLTAPQIDYNPTFVPTEQPSRAPTWIPSSMPSIPIVTNTNDDDSNASQLVAATISLAVICFLLLSAIVTLIMMHLRNKGKDTRQGEEVRENPIHDKTAIEL